jgi:hypothetical protein
MTRAEFLQPLLERAGEVDAFIFDDWEVIPGYIGGEHAATVILKGTEIHFGITPAFRKRAALFRRESNRFFGPLLERMGFLTTRVVLTAKEQKQFVERVGFKPTWSDTTFQYYMLSALPFARSK